MDTKGKQNFDYVLVAILYYDPESECLFPLLLLYRVALHEGVTGRFLDLCKKSDIKQ